MTLDSLLKSFARTVVPAVVGLVITLALRAGVDLHGYAPEITTAVTACYYLLVRLAEERLSPSFGWLLGVAASPRYARQAGGRARLPRHRDRGVVDTGGLLAAAVVAALMSLIVVLSLRH